MKNSGLKLAESFYFKIIKEKLESKFPDLKYAAGLIGHGSEVLGYDDTISQDHHWGPRIQIFLSNDDYSLHKESLIEYFRYNLPYKYQGYSCNWTPPLESNNQFLEDKVNGPINHRIEIITVQKYMKIRLGIENLEVSDIDWLSIPEQRLLEFTRGKIFFDNIGEITKAREFFNYYPENIWYYKLKCQWAKIDEEKAFVGRPGEKDNDINSRIESSRLIRLSMKLCFLIYKKYTPYYKWFGKGFNELPISAKLNPIFLNIFTAETWQKRENLLCDLFLEILKEQSKLGIIPELDLEKVAYFSRNQTVIMIEEIITELHKKIPINCKFSSYPMGAVDQFIDETNSLSNSEIFRKSVFFFN